MHNYRFAAFVLFVLIAVVGCGAQPTEPPIPTVAVIPPDEAPAVASAEQPQQDDTVIIADTVDTAAVPETVVQNTAPEPQAQAQAQVQDEVQAQTQAQAQTQTQTNMTRNNRQSRPQNTAPDTAPPQQQQEVMVDTPPQEVVEDQVMLRFDANTPPQERQQFIASLGGTVTQEISALDTVVIELSQENKARLDEAQQNNQTPLVRTEPEYLVRAQANIAPQDSYYSQQWNLTAIYMETRWANFSDDAPTITVAVVDSGVCLNHPDLDGRLLPGYDYVEDDTIPQDENGHGCGMSGVIAANINTIGVAGVAPNVQVMPLRVLDENSVGTYSDVAAAVIDAADNGADVINLSLAGYYPSTVMEDAVKYAASRGVVVVAAAGNAGQETSYYPAAYAEVMSIGSVDEGLSISSFSNYGDTIDLYAPGGGIWSTHPVYEYARFSGTSPAAAHVSAIAAMRIAEGKSLNAPNQWVLFDEPALQTNEEEEVEAQAIQGIIGGDAADDRVTISDTSVLPYSSIAQILIDGQPTCTAILISPEHVLTLAECVVPSAGNNLVTSATSVAVVPGRSGSTEPYGKIFVDRTPSEVDVSADWDPANPVSSENYAVLKLQTPLPGNLVNTLNLVSATNAVLVNNPYTLSGYPSAGRCKIIDFRCGQIQNAATGSLFDPVELQNNVPAGELRYQLDAETVGQRGSPVFRPNAGEFDIVGLHIGYGGFTSGASQQEYNYGLRVTGNMITEVQTTWGIPINGTAGNPIVITVEDSVTLRTEIINANNSGDPTTLILSPGGTYLFQAALDDGTTVLPAITGDITIIGRGATIQEVSANSRRMAIVNNGGSLTLSDVTVTDFVNNSSGGGVLVQNGGTLNIIDAVFENNTADLGGGIFASGGSTVYIETSRFYKNTANNNGGAIFTAGDMTILNQDDPNAPDTLVGFGDNAAENSSGGAILAANGTLSVSGTAFVNNFAGSSADGGNGGALTTANGATVTVTSSGFVNNGSSQNGGAIAHSSSGAVSFTNTVFNFNRAGPESPDDNIVSGAGAVLYSVGTGQVTMTDIEANENITYRKDEAAATNDNLIGGAFDISGPFVIQSSTPNEVQNFIQGNKILFDEDLDQDATDAARVSKGAAFYVHGDGFNVSVTDTCINSNVSLEFQGIYKEGSATVTAERNWWGAPNGPSGNPDGISSGNGDGVTTGVDVTPILTSLPTDDCNETILPPTNDDLINAFVLELLEDSETFDNSTANLGNFLEEEGQDVKKDDPTASCGITNKSIWYTYTPIKNYDISLSVNPYPVEDAVPIVSIYSDPDPNNPVELGCDVGDVNGSVIDPALIPSVSVTAGTTYYIMVGSTGSAGGTTNITVEPEQVTLSNPLNNSTLGSRQPNFVWTTVGYADRYVLDITGSGITTFDVTEEILPADCGANTCEYTLISRLPNGDYTWNVTAIDDTPGLGASAEQRSTTRSFAINSTEEFNLVIDGEFNNGLQEYLFLNANIDGVVTDGVLNVRRLSAAPQTSVYTVITEQVEQNEAVEFFIDLGNSSSEPKHVTVGLYNGNAPTGAAITCEFLVPANTELTGYIVRGEFPGNWSETWAAVSPEDFGEQSLLVDNLIVARNERADLSLPCVSPDLPDEQQLIVNSRFDHGTAAFNPTGNLNTAVAGVDNTLESSRTDFAEAASISQNIRNGVPGDTALQAQVDLGNSDANPINVTLQLANPNNAAQTFACEFTVPANTALETYTLRGRTPIDIDNLEFKLLIEDFNQTSLLVDNVDVRLRPTLTVQTIFCDAPYPENNNMVANGNFVGGTTFYSFNGSVSRNTNGERLNMTRTNTANESYVTQTLRYRATANSPFVVSVNLRNTNNQSKPIQVRLSNSNNASQNFTCDFVIPGYTPFRTYTMRGVAGQNWNSIDVEIFLLDDNEPNLQVDNLSVVYDSSLSLSNTECEDASFVDNGDFSEGTTGWRIFGGVRGRVRNGLGEGRRSDTSNDSAARKSLTEGLSEGDKIQLSVDLGNSNANPRRARLELRNADNTSDRVTCEFIVPGNSDPKTYYLRRFIPNDWPNAELLIYFDDYNEINLLVDNAIVAQLGGFTVDSLSECDAPLPDVNKNLVVNKSFQRGTDWYEFVRVDNSLNAGVLNINQNAGNYGFARQILPFDLPQGSPLEVKVQLGNSSTERKGVRILITDGSELNDGFFCNFFIDPSTPLQQYTVQAEVPSDWDSVGFGIYMNTELPSLRIDNLDLRYRPNQDYSSRNCIRPGAGGAGDLIEAAGVPVIEEMQMSPMIVETEEAIPAETEEAPTEPIATEEVPTEPVATEEAPTEPLVTEEAPTEETPVAPVVTEEAAPAEAPVMEEAVVEETIVEEIVVEPESEEAPAATEEATE